MWWFKCLGRMQHITLSFLTLLKAALNALRSFIDRRYVRFAQTLRSKASHASSGTTSLSAVFICWGF